MLGLRTRNRNGDLKKRLKPYGIRPKKSMAKAKEDCWKVTERKMGWSGDYLWTWGFEPSEEEIIERKREWREPPEQRSLREFERGEGEYLSSAGSYYPHYLSLTSSLSLLNSV